MTANAFWEDFIQTEPWPIVRKPYVIAEIGINHNGDLELAKQMIEPATRCGASAVKFQKRTPELCVPPHQRDVLRETPWGLITYMAYRYKVEFGRAEYDAIDAYCRRLGIDWFASPWDVPSLEFLRPYGSPYNKIPSAMLTNLPLVRAYSASLPKLTTRCHSVRLCHWPSAFFHDCLVAIEIVVTTVPDGV